VPWVLPRTVHVAYDETAGAALLDERSGRWYHLSRPGAVLLRTVLTGAPPEDAAPEAGAPPDALRALLGDLRAADLLMWSSGEDPTRPPRQRSLCQPASWLRLWRRGEGTGR
jgi:hypothetical protein